MPIVHISTHQEIGHCKWGNWDFLTYNMSASFKEFPGVYIFSRNIDGEPYAVYIGQAQKMSDRISTHKSDSMGIIGNSDQIHVLDIWNGSGEMNRIEWGLVGLCNPPLNKMHRTGPAPKEIRKFVPDILYP